MRARFGGPPSPTNPRAAVDAEHARWSEAYAGAEYFYGDEPGPVARRAVRYHRAFLPEGGSALDAGCGEGQDLAFLAERGYAATGAEFTAAGAEKARRLLAARGLAGTVLEADLRTWVPPARYDLVLAVNSVQFLGAAAPGCLDRLAEAVAPGGVLALSLFAREAAQAALAGTLWFTTLPELLARFSGWQCLEAARLWQWNLATDDPQPFVTLIARRSPPARPGARYTLE